MYIVIITICNEPMIVIIYIVKSANMYIYIYIIGELLHGEITFDLKVKCKFAH